MARRRTRSDKGKPRRAHQPDGTFTADDPATPENEAFETVEAPASDQKRTKVCDGPTSGYRDGKDGLIETADFADGWLPAGWLDSPGKCKNSDGEHCEYVKVKADEI